MFFSKKIDQRVPDIMGISNLGMYLELPLLKGRVKRDDFAPIIDKVNTRLTSWKHKFLNRTGRLCLAKSVLSSLLVYAMHVVWLLEYVFEYVDKCIRSCIWAKGGQSRGWNLVRLREIVRAKSKGGLGIRSTRNNNVVVLGKLVDNLHGHDKLWVTTLSQNYLSGDLILARSYNYDDSYIWKGIIKAKDRLANGFGAPN